jgi:hypothetical protein
MQVTSQSHDFYSIRFFHRNLCLLDKTFTRNFLHFLKAGELYNLHRGILKRMHHARKN